MYDYLYYAALVYFGLGLLVYIASWINPTFVNMIFRPWLAIIICFPFFLGELIVYKIWKG